MLNEIPPRVPDKRILDEEQTSTESTETEEFTSSYSTDSSEDSSLYSYRPRWRRMFLAKEAKCK